MLQKVELESTLSNTLRWLATLYFAVFCWSQMWSWYAQQLVSTCNEVVLWDKLKGNIARVFPFNLYRSHAVVIFLRNLSSEAIFWIQKWFGSFLKDSALSNKSVTGRLIFLSISVYFGLLLFWVIAGQTKIRLLLRMWCTHQ